MKQTKQTHKVEKCNNCKYKAMHTSTLSPTGHWVCNNCGFITAEVPQELIITQFGYTFRDAPKKKIVKFEWV